MLSLVPGVFGFFGKQSGIILALRRDGEEALFIGKEIAAPVWIPIGSFMIDPKAVITPDEARRMMEE